MNSNLFVNYYVRAISLGLVAACITGNGNLRAQQAPPVAPSPVPPAVPAVEPTAVDPPRRVTPPVAPVFGVSPAPVAPVEQPIPKPAPLPPPTIPGPAYGEGGSARGGSSRLGPPSAMRPSPGAPITALTRNILDEELNADPQAAAKNYEAMIANFDQQRESAAQAIFRLGESYRKMGRIEEARSMYARILREFVDFPDLAKLSQRMLSENAPTQTGRSIAYTAEAPNPAEQDLMRQELALLEKELADTESLVKSGLAGQNSGLSLKREILQLKQRLARTRTQEWPAPVPVESRSNQVSASGFRAYADISSSDPGRLKDEIRDIESQIELLSGKVQPETLSTKVIKDPRFAELKSDYERRLLNATGDAESEKDRAPAQERLKKWIQEIYLPELESTLAIKNGSLKALEKRSELRRR
jgi:tetratricopeptide (TPR) repeat protein